MNNFDSKNPSGFYHPSHANTNYRRRLTLVFLYWWYGVWYWPAISACKASAYCGHRGYLLLNL